MCIRDRDTAPEIDFPAQGTDKLVFVGNLHRIVRQDATGAVGIHRECRKQCGFGLPQHGLSLPVLCLGLGDGQVLPVVQFHQAIQFGVVENPPPLSARVFVGRSGGFPQAVFLVGSRDVGVGPDIVRADGTAAQQGGGQRERKREPCGIRHGNSCFRRERTGWRIVSHGIILCRFRPFPLWHRRRFFRRGACGSGQDTDRRSVSCTA